MKLEKDERDIISSLPDHLLSSMISYLPLKYAVRTSILSRRWARLWCASITSLTIDPDSMNCRSTTESSESDQIENLNKWIGIVDSIFECCQVSIRECQIDYHLPQFLRYKYKRWAEILTDDVIERLVYSYERWAEILTRGGIERLVLQGKQDLGNVTFSNLNCESLRFLQLGHCTLGPKSSFIAFRNLRVLTLVDIYLKGHHILDGISRCVNLESLHLVSCCSAEDLTIHAPNLKDLYLWLNWGKKVDLDIDGPNLTTIVLYAVGQVKRLCVRAPYLQSSRINMSMLWTTKTKMIYDQIQSMEFSVQEKMKIFKLCRPSTKNILDLQGRSIEVLAANNVSECLPTPFNMLRNLYIDVNLKYQRHAHVVAVLLERCPHIRKLNVALNSNDIRNAHYSEEPSLGYWDSHGPYHCLNACLEEVRVSHFRAQDYEVEFAKFIMANARVLKRLSIRRHGLCHDPEADQEVALAEAKKNLIALQKASSYASIDLKF